MNRQDAMTTAQTMLPRYRGFAAMMTVMAALASACARERPIVAPEALLSPYPSHRGVVLAVAPLRNESGVSLVDELAVSDALVSEAQQVVGLSVLPVNRTLAGMRALNLGTVSNEAEALALCRVLGADAIIVGTITAWHPYEPPVIGLSLGLLGAGPEVEAGQPAAIDTFALRAAATEGTVGDARVAARPLSAVSEVLDASNGGTLLLVRRYAEGRHDPDSALGWRRYTASMSLYAKFACHEMTRRLLEAERQRLGVAAARGNRMDAR